MHRRLGAVPTIKVPDAGWAAWPRGVGRGARLRAYRDSDASLVAQVVDARLVPALQLFSEWALTLPGLDRLELYVEPWNEGSWRAAERAGFQREGLLRSWERVGSEPKDMFMYSRLPGVSDIRG